ncbi:MAG: sugar transferase [Planctomycetota bacterium]
MMPQAPQDKARVAAIFIDALVFNLAIVLGYLVCGLPFGRVLLRESSFASYRELYWLPLFAAPIGFYFSGLYRRDPYRLLVRSAEKAFMGGVTTILLVLAVTYGMRGELAALQVLDAGGATAQELRTAHWGISLSVLVFTAVAGPAFVVLWRFWANRLESRLFGWSIRPHRLLVAGRLSRGDFERLARQHSPCYQLVGFLEAGASPEAPHEDVRFPCLGCLGDAARVLREKAVEELMIVSNQASRAEILELAALAAEQRARAWVVADAYDATLSAVSPRLYNGAPVFEIRETAISGWTHVSKRLIDIGVSAAALAVAFPFLILPACIAIVIETKGFPIFTQNRVGKNGRIFRLYKLRTMIPDAEHRGPALTEAADPRITRVGRWLRRTSLDELPQLWNVLMGDMSLVGPRAVVPYVAERFEEWERATLNVKPGLTGLAQVSGRDEVGFREKSLLSLYYVRNYSLWLDLRILFATVGVVLSMEGTEGTRRE